MNIETTKGIFRGTATETMTSVKNQNENLVKNRFLQSVKGRQIPYVPLKFLLKNTSKVKALNSNWN